LRYGWGQSYCHVIRIGAFVYDVRHPNPHDYARAQEVARKVMQDELPDNTNGAMYFHATYLRHLPNWAKPQYLTARIGGNVFYRDRTTPLQVALQ
jgi:spore germination cell wall hydrolase CwlJ-like protein